MNKQPFYHRMEVLFTATRDVSVDMNKPEFIAELKKLLKRRFGSAVLLDSVDYDSPVSAEPGDPHDL